MWGKYITEQKRNIISHQMSSTYCFSHGKYLSHLSSCFPISSQTDTLGMALVQTIFNSQEKKYKELMSGCLWGTIGLLSFKYLSINLEKSWFYFVVCLFLINNHL